MKARFLVLPLSTLAIIGLSLIASADTAQNEQAVQAASEKKFQPCMWPNPCGPSGSQKPALPPKQTQMPAKVPQFKAPLHSAVAFSPDPLQQQIVEKSIQDEGGGGGVVSAMRLRDGQGPERIVYSNEAGLALPGSKIASKAGKAASAPADKDWNSVDMKTASVAQINGMRDQRRALSGAEADSKAGSDKMWGNGRKPVQK